jgi:hypothetical protein
MHLDFGHHLPVFGHGLPVFGRHGSRYVMLASAWRHRGVTPTESLYAIISLEERRPVDRLKGALVAVISNPPRGRLR